VHGSAAGAGMSLACACDVVVAAESAKFVMAYTRIGLNPDGSGTWFLPRLVGWRRAAELMLTNRTLTATEARDWGIATSVVPDDEVANAALALATELAAGPTRAFGSVKRLLRLSATAGLETQLQHETDEIAANAAGHDGSEGMKAFLEKRPPSYEGA
jgi:2-(1,2-epoxy-1,2-dihydrophenyl)acetyl-CoA isomerase